ncbi:hypothetical protein Tco_1312528 [Tanacetum coccineum]
MVKIPNIDILNEFWNTTSSQTVNDEKQIHATIDSKAVVVTEASIRSSLLLNDVVGTACLTNEAIFQNLALMGYEGELNKLTFQKSLFSPQWKYLIHTILYCLSLKSTSWNEFSTNIASAVICLATNQKFNFSKLIFDGMLRNLDNPKKKFLMYPRFLMVFLNNQIKLGEPFNDVYITPAHTLKVFSNMSRKGVKFSRKVTPLFDSMLVPHQAPEGEGSEQPTEPQPTPSPTQPSTGDQPPVTDSSSSHDTTQDSRDSLEGTNGSEGDQRNHEGGRLRKETEELNELVLELQSTRISTSYSNDPPTNNKCGLKMRNLSVDVYETKAELEKEEEERQRQELASVDYITNLYDEVQAKMDASEEKKQLAVERSTAIRKKPPIRTQLRSLMMTYLNHTCRYKHAQLNKKTLEEIQALYIKEQERAADFMPIGSEEDERMIEKMNKKAASVDEEEVLEEPNNLEEEEQLKAFLMIVPNEEGEIDYEVLDKRYPIVDWESKFYHTDRYGKPHDYYRVFRADESSRYIKTFTENDIQGLDRLDFIELQ